MKTSTIVADKYYQYLVTKKHATAQLASYSHDNYRCFWHESGLSKLVDLERTRLTDTVQIAIIHRPKLHPPPLPSLVSLYVSAPSRHPLTCFGVMLARFSCLARISASRSDPARPAGRRSAAACSSEAGPEEETSSPAGGTTTGERRWFRKLSALPAATGDGEGGTGQSRAGQARVRAGQGRAGQCR